MSHQALIGTVALAAALAVALADAQAFDESKYPDWSGAWRRIPVPGVTGQPGYDQTKRLGPPQQAPLTPEARAIMEASMAEQAKGGQGNYPTYVCLSPGMPRIMTPYGMMEIVITPETTPILLHHLHAPHLTPARAPSPPPAVPTPMIAPGPRRSPRPCRAIRSASGSIPTATAATTRSRSRPAASAGHGHSTRPGCRCTATIRPSSRSGS